MFGVLAAIGLKRPGLWSDVASDMTANINSRPQQGPGWAQVPPPAYNQPPYNQYQQAPQAEVVGSNAPGWRELPANLSQQQHASCQSSNPHPVEAGSQPQPISNPPPAQVHEAQATPISAVSSRPGWAHWSTHHPSPSPQGPQQPTQIYEVAGTLEQKR
jgi:hypothetical protein